DVRALAFGSVFSVFSSSLDAGGGVCGGGLGAPSLPPPPPASRARLSSSPRYAKLPEGGGSKTATSIWARINLVNLHENILPTRQRADLILKKGESHTVEQVALRKL